MLQLYLAISNIVLAFILGIAIYKLKTNGNKLLAFLIFAYGAHSILLWGGGTFHNSHFLIKYLANLSFPCAFIFGSLILLFTEKILHPDKKLKIQIHLVAPITAIVVYVLFLLVFYNEWTPDKIIAMEGFQKRYVIITGSCIVIYNITLSVMALNRVLAYRELSQQQFSNDIFQSTRWLILFLGLNLVFFVTGAIAIVFNIIYSYGKFFVIFKDSLTLVMLLVFIYHLMTKSSETEIVEADNKADEKYLKTNLPEEMRKQYARDIETYMLEQKAFLDENISIGQLSKRLKIPQHHLSMTINIEFNKNFFNYINAHRIRYAEKLLTDPKSKDETILMIAYNSGFQSKTTFNKYFKSLNGITPSEYRKTMAVS